jgi:hypothetical protein
MKLLADNAIIELIAGCSDEHLIAAQAAMPLPGDDAPEDWLLYGIKEGFYQSCTVNRDGETVGAIAYSKNDRGMLVVNACVSLRPDLDLFNAFELAFRRLAAATSCKSIEYVTKRAGGIVRAKRMGYKICGVVLRREITGREMDDAKRPQELQRNFGSLFSTSSQSQQSTSTAYNTQNQQVGVSGGGQAIGAGSSGNTIDISTTDEADLEASLAAGTNVADTGLAAGTTIAGASLAASVQALQGANATAQAGLGLGAAVASGAVAANTNVAGAAIAGAENEAETSASLDEELGGTAIAATTNIAGAAIAGELAANQQSNNLVTQSINAVVAGNANSNATLASVMTSFTNALSQSTTGAQELAAGALSQEGQIAGGSEGVAVAPIPQIAVGSSTSGLSGKAEIAIAIGAALLIVLALSRK